MHQPPYAPQGGGSRGNPALIIGIVAVIAIVIGAGAFFLLQDDDSGDSTTTDTTETDGSGGGSNGPDEPNFDQLPDFPERTDPTDGSGSDPGTGNGSGSGTGSDPGTGTGDVTLGEPSSPPTGAGSQLDGLAQDCYQGDMEACDDLVIQGTDDFDYIDYGITCGGRVDPLEAGDFLFCEDLS